MPYSIEQQKENRRKWVGALRSGKFKQGNGALQNESGECCLGVGCIATGVPVTGSYSGVTIFGSSGAYLAPREFIERVGLRTEWGTFSKGELAAMNDNGTPFSQIADIIESEPAGLFTEPGKAE